jgi:alpha-L-rhamnosidase
MQKSPFTGGIEYGYSIQGGKTSPEYLENPIGMDEERPRFSWIMEDSRSSAFQSAYQIVVNDESGAEVWDSGKVESGDSVR